MATTFTDNLGSGATSITMTLNSLASSATAGRQSSAVTLIDGNNNVPQAIEIDAAISWTTGTAANDKAIYFFLARSIDGTNYESGPPAVGTSDAAFTFSNSPVGTSPSATDLLYLGAIAIVGQSESHRKVFRVFSPPAKFILIALNYSGIALASSGNSVQYRVRQGDGR